MLLILTSAILSAVFFTNVCVAPGPPSACGSGCGPGANCRMGAFFMSCMCDQPGYQYVQANGEAQGKCVKPEGFCEGQNDCPVGKVCCDFAYCDAPFTSHECMEQTSCQRAGCGGGRVVP